jgi:hypothetical protein
MMQLKSVNIEKISETGLLIAALLWDGVLGLRGCFKGSRRSEKSFYTLKTSSKTDEGSHSCAEESDACAEGSHSCAEDVSANAERSPESAGSTSLSLELTTQ